MPVDYSKGKVYALRSHQTEQVYIGSTCSPLYKRLGGHKADYRKYLNQKQHYITSFEITKFEDCYIELVKECVCENKNQLSKEEGIIMRETDNCVNRCIAGRSIEMYREDNKKIKTEYMKEYGKKNREIINAKKKLYYANNRERLCEQAKQNAIKNKEKNITIECDICGSKIKRNTLSRHKKTTKRCQALADN